MFPNFKSLAQREQKRQNLLERVQRRLKQSSIKRDMYEGALWASDVDKSMNLDKGAGENPSHKMSSSTQTDSSEALKKTLSDKFSQTNPDVSPSVITELNISPVMVDAEVDNSARTKSTSTNTNPVLVNDKNVQARPVTNDVGVSNSPQMVNAGVNTNSTKPPEINDKNVDAEEQVHSRNWIKNLYINNPNWASIGIHPIRRKTGRPDTNYVISEKGSLRTLHTGKKYKGYKHIDWISTENLIRDILYEAESNSIDEVGAMRDEETQARTFTRLEKKKRSGDELEELDVVLKDRRLPDIKFGRKSTSTETDNDQSRMQLLWIISKNLELLESNGLTKSVLPIYNDKYKSDGSSLKKYVWVKNGSIDVYGKESNLKHPASNNKVNWQSTLRSFLDMVKSRGVELSMVGKMDTQKYIIKYESTADDDIREARHGSKSGIDEDMDQNLSIPDSEAKKMLYEYYQKLYDEKVMIPFHLQPVVESRNGVKAHPTYYFGSPSVGKYLSIRNKENKVVSGKAWTELMKTIRWMDTFNLLLDKLEDIHQAVSNIEAPATKEELKMIDNVNANFKIIREVIFSNASDIKVQSAEQYDHDEVLQTLLDDSERAYQVYGEAQKNFEIVQKQVETRQKEARGSNSQRTNSNLKAIRSALRAAKAAVSATKTVYYINAKKYHDMKLELEKTKGRIQGRGLRGAGVAPLEGVVRRGRTYNLNEIQGLATPSAYVYRQLGSKYIRLPDLDAKTLVLVQPNRRKCGPKCQISDSLQAMIKSLVYKQYIDQASYDKLRLEDKKMFKEILAITHLQYNFHDKLDDPLNTLRAEYDKLKGEIELGNDNPSIIKQLKSLTVDMYTNQLIKDQEFKDIITRLL